MKMKFLKGINTVSDKNIRIQPNSMRIDKVSVGKIMDNSRIPGYGLQIHYLFEKDVQIVDFIFDLTVDFSGIIFPANNLNYH